MNKIVHPPFQFNEFPQFAERCPYRRDCSGGLVCVRRESSLGDCIEYVCPRWRANLDFCLTLHPELAIAERLYELFVFRPDVYARQCGKRWCSVRKSITPCLIIGHLKGETTLGVYQLTEDDTVGWICFDVDPSKVVQPQELAKALTKYSRERWGSRSVLLEASRYPDPSFHVWVFFQQIPARVARHMAWSVLDQVKREFEAEGKRAEACGCNSVEMFPKQETLKDAPEGLGNLVKLPLGLHRKYGLWSKLLNPETLSPLPERTLFSIEPAEVSQKAIADIEAVIENEVETKKARSDFSPVGQVNIDFLPCIRAFRESPIKPSKRHDIVGKNFAILYRQHNGRWAGFEEWARGLVTKQPDFQFRDITGWKCWVEHGARRVNCHELNSFLREHIEDFNCKACELRKPSLDLAEEVDELPKNLPNEWITVVEAALRVGKTRWLVERIIEGGEGNYVTHRHSICEHAARIFEELAREKGSSLRAVHLEGKSREGMCRTGNYNCNSCPMKPDDHDPEHIGFGELKKEVIALLKAGKVLDRSGIPGNLCPYFTLRAAASEAEVRFTVIELLEGLEPRKILALDESPTLQRFYPRSTEVLEIHRTRGEVHIRNLLDCAWPKFEFVKERIENKQRKSRIDKDCLSVIERLENVKNRLNVREITHAPLEDILTKLDFEPLEVDDPEGVLKEIWELSAPLKLEEDLNAWVEPVIFPFKRAFHWVTNRGSARSTLYAVGDASEPKLHLSGLASHEKVLVVGGIEARRFAKTMAERFEADAKFIEVRGFPFERNFVVLPVDAAGEDDADARREKRRLKIRKLARSICTVNERERIPVLVLTGSERSQQSVARSIGEIAHLAKEGGEDAQRWNHLGGFVNVFYQNSVISRGLDVDQYDVLLVHDVDFVHPYWAAREALARANGDEEDGRFAKRMSFELTREEATNSALRITPVRGRDEFQPKAIVVPVHDLPKLGLLQDRVVARSDEAPGIGKIGELIATFARRSKLSYSDSPKEHTDCPDEVNIRGNRSELNTSFLQKLVVESSFLDWSRSFCSDLESEHVNEEVINKLEEGAIRALERAEKAGKRLSTEVLLARAMDYARYKRVGVARKVLQKLHSSRKIEFDREGRRKMWSLAAPGQSTLDRWRKGGESG